ncbi:hypothetical protein D3C77_445970 [compost metagenome]
MLLGEDLLGTREATGTATIGASHLGDGPQQARLDWGGLRVHVMAVEAQAGFQAQGVASPQTNGCHFRFGQQATGKCFGLVGRYRNLETVFAGVARAADKAVRTQQLHGLELHEGHLRNRGRQALQHLHRRRALQGQQGAFLEQWHDLAVLADVLLQVRQVLVLAGGVDHQEQFVVAQVGNHQVIEDATVFIGEHRVALHAHGQIDDVHRYQGFQGLGGAGTQKADLAHVRDIEQPGLFTGMQVFLHDPKRVLHRHVVAGERHHARAQFKVQGVQRGLLQCFGGH